MLVIRGRRFTKATLRAVRRCIERHSIRGRTYISVAVCEALNWRQPNGWLKDRACRDALLKLHNLGIIKLPPRRTKPTPLAQRGKQYVGRSTFNPVDYAQGDLVLAWAKGNNLESTWNRLIRDHHYLGHKVVVGRCIKYLVKRGEEIVAAISFSSAAWHLEERSLLLSELGIPPWDTRDLVINNSRYLLLSEKGSVNLASRILALATSRIASDWYSYYSIRPRIAETFVEPTRFEGTCYKAANWVMVGRTMGYKKAGSMHSNSQQPKLIFLYGLTPTTRCRLNELALRTRNPDAG